MRYVALFGFIVLSFGAAALGGSVTDTQGWYQELVKPSWNPPGWVFAPVWTVLYAMIAFAGWRLYDVKGIHPAHGLWLGQLGLNALWSVLFFGQHLILWAFVEILVLLAAIVATIAAFGREDRVAALLLVPYALWVTFASALNGTLLSLNGPS